jgi:uncharacterized BrkB/YihY/UPF0761 family membrane protein
MGRMGCLGAIIFTMAWVYFCIRIGGLIWKLISG